MAAKIKVKEYDSFHQYELDEHSSDYDLVAIVNFNVRVCADLQTECKNWRTAVNRFFKALDGDSRFEGWKDSITGYVEGGIWKDHETDREGNSTGGWSWGVEGNDGIWYIFLSVRREVA